MSAPIRNEDRSQDGIEDPLCYAPRWARQAPPVAPELSAFTPAPPTAPGIAHGSAPAPSSAAPTAAHRLAHAPSMAPTITDTSPMAPGIGGPNIDLPPPRLRPFEGDVAVKELRRRLALEPEVMPEPPIRRQLEPAVPWIGRFSVILVVAAVVTFALTLLMLPRESRQLAGGVAATPTAAPDAASHASAPTLPARLIVENQRAFANEPLPLGVSLNDASGGEIVTLIGLASGTKLTAGMPLGLTGWQMSARDLGKAYAHAPKDFIGVMDAAIDLRSSRDRLVDSQVVRLEWVQKKEARLTPRHEPSKPPSVVQTLDPEEIATLLRRGEEFLRNGDIAGARLFLRRAASAGSAQAALALGVTFDPAFLAERGVLGFAPDPVQARTWYEKAAELGSDEAPRRLHGLQSWGR
jgi:hypothetical protein